VIRDSIYGDNMIKGKLNISKNLLHDINRYLDGKITIDEIIDKHINK